MLDAAVSQIELDNVGYRRRRRGRFFLLLLLASRERITWTMIVWKRYEWSFSVVSNLTVHRCCCCIKWTFFQLSEMCWTWTYDLRWKWRRSSHDISLDEVFARFIPPIGRSSSNSSLELFITFNKDATTNFFHMSNFNCSWSKSSSSSVSKTSYVAFISLPTHFSLAIILFFLCDDEDRKLFF